MTQRQIMHWLVSYADTDAGGVIYHGRYIEQAERSRHQLLLDVGLPFSMLENEYDCLLVVRAIDARYEKPAALGQNLHVACNIRKSGPAYSVWETRIRHDKAHLCTVAAKMVCLSARNKNLRTMPHDLLARLCANPSISSQ